MSHFAHIHVVQFISKDETLFPLLNAFEISFILYFHKEKLYFVFMPTMQI